MLNIKELSLAELFDVYNFVKEDYNRAFGNKKEARKIIADKMEEIQEELYVRVYGENPHRAGKVNPNIISFTVGGSPMDLTKTESNPFISFIPSQTQSENK